MASDLNSKIEQGSRWLRHNWPTVLKCIVGVAAAGAVVTGTCVELAPLVNMVGIKEVLEKAPEMIVAGLGIAGGLVTADKESRKEKHTPDQESAALGTDEGDGAVRNPLNTDARRKSPRDSKVLHERRGALELARLHRAQRSLLGEVVPLAGYILGGMPVAYIIWQLSHGLEVGAVTVAGAYAYIGLKRFVGISFLSN